jgi:hypothetical protein
MRERRAGVALVFAGSRTTNGMKGTQEGTYANRDQHFDLRYHRRLHDPRVGGAEVAGTLLAITSEHVGEYRHPASLRLDMDTL